MLAIGAVYLKLGVSDDMSYEESVVRKMEVMDMSRGEKRDGGGSLRSVD